MEDREVFRRAVLKISGTGIQNVYVLLTQSRRLPRYRYGGEGRDAWMRSKAEISLCVMDYLIGCL